MTVSTVSTQLGTSGRGVGQWVNLLEGHSVHRGAALDLTSKLWQQIAKGPRPPAMPFSNFFQDFHCCNERAPPRKREG